MPQPGRERTRRTRSRFQRKARGNSRTHYLQRFRSIATFQNKFNLKA